MVKSISKVKEIDVAAVAGNKTLSAGVDRRAVERCKDAIEKLGVLHTPIVGTTQDGRRLILSGQCELTALRELGVKKMDAIEVGVECDAGASAKLALLLIALKDKPGALCEGLLLQEAVCAGIPRMEIQSMIGKSASWVSNRISLVTRLDRNVYEMVKAGLLEARSAEEIARLPAQAQFAFAEVAVRGCLPKSAVESLVAGYNDKDCPEAVKAQILSDPRAAMQRMADRRRSVSTGRQGRTDASLAGALVKCMGLVKAQVARLNGMLFNGLPFKAADYMHTLEELEVGLSVLLKAIRALIYPGKMGANHNEG